MQNGKVFSRSRSRSGYAGNSWGGNNGRSRFNSGFKRGSGNKRSFSEKIDVSKFIRTATDLEREVVEIKHAFSDFSFSTILKENLATRGYLTPTPIQDQAINSILEGRDLIGLANTGTGKTGAFLLPLIEKTFKDHTQKVLIIAPTRELAQQIQSEFTKFAQGLRIFSSICVGGTPIFRQINDLRRRPSFVIGTPGRLKDLSKRNIIKFADFQNIVLDEVDRMLDMGFIDEIKEMLKGGPENRQSLFFSATMPPKIKNLASQFLKDPVTIAVSKEGETTKNVNQDIIRVQSHSTKFTQLQDLLNREEVKKTLVFVETKREVEKLTIDLAKFGHKVDSIHGDKRQGQRQKALTQFKDNFITVLVATDVAARGLDIKEVSHVVNYTVPKTLDDYIHRIGRTGRGMNKGFAFTFVD